MANLLSNLVPGESPFPSFIEDLKGVEIGGRKVDSAYTAHNFKNCIEGLEEMRYDLISFAEFLQLFAAYPRQLGGQATLLKEAIVFDPNGQAGNLVGTSPLTLAVERGQGHDLYSASGYIDEAKKSGEAGLNNPVFAWKPTENHPELAYFFAQANWKNAAEFSEMLTRSGIEEILFNLRENIPKLNSNCPVGQLAVSAYQDRGLKRVLVTSYGLLPRGEEHDPVHKTWYGGMERRMATVGNPKQKPDLVNCKFRMRGIRASA